MIGGLYIISFRIRKPHPKVLQPLQRRPHFLGICC